MDKNQNCGFCRSKNLVRVTSDSVFFPSYSENKLLKNHANYLCKSCGIVAMNPQPDKALLKQIYAGVYRDSSFSISISEHKKIDLPIQFPESAYSFLRLENFIACSKLIDKDLGSPSYVIDLGGYQGLFLYAMREAYGIDGMVVDFNEKGIEYAKESLGFESSIVIDDVLDIDISRKADLVTLIHSFEHMTDPKKVLQYIRSTLLVDDGYVYIEVPNLYGSSLNDPTHLFTFSEESLSYILSCSGFNVLKIFTTGIKHPPLGLINDEVVLCCLAKKADMPLTPIDMPTVRDETYLNKNYRRHSRAAIKKHILNIGKQVVQLFYYIGVEYFLAKLPGKLESKLKWIKSRVKYRAH